MEERPRKIIHVDMDAFYASVEQRDRPELRGRPVIVGGRPGMRGVVAACSYEARAFGVRSAMPTTRAERLCPDAVFVRPRMDRYVGVSREVRQIFRQVTDRVEPLSLDEAYLDVTENKLSEPSAGKLARHLKEEIKQRTGLTASAGVGPSKLVAKIASDVNKPDGFLVVRPEDVAAFLAPLPVSRLWGVGPKTAERLAELNIKTVEDVRRADIGTLTQRLGRYGAYLLAQAWGDDDRTVESEREAKSRGSETTFLEDEWSVSALCHTLQGLSEQVSAELVSMETRARTVTLKLRYADFTTITRSRSVPRPLQDAASIYEIAKDLLVTATQAGSQAVRLIGVSVSTLQRPGAPEQLFLPW
ncbi:MAG: DNA polymerase IV [Myxococcales bacterium]